MKEESIIYRCDSCNATLSEGGEGVNHLSLVFRKHSGWVKKVDTPYHDGNGWKVKAKWKIIGTDVIGIKQFCNGNCLAHFFKEIET